MINLKTKLANAAWDLGPISKTLIPAEMLKELTNDFSTQHDIEVLNVEKLDDLNTYTVSIRGKESIELYSTWMAIFEEHGYEPPFLVIDNGLDDGVES